jgi:hypothetical protein
MKKSLRVLCFIAIVAMTGTTAATADMSIPEPPEPTLMGTPSAGPDNYEPRASQQCKDLTVQYVCGTEQKCDYLEGRGMVCTEVEKYCTRTETVCP